MNRVVTTARAILGNGRCAIMGYDARGNMLVGVVCKPKRISAWLNSRDPQGDLRRCQQKLGQTERDCSIGERNGHAG